MNKYQKILDEISLAICLEQDIGHYRLMVLQELIDLHNEPLKLNEIEDGMWVWDSRHKEYIQIVNKLGVVINRYKPQYNKSASTLFQVNRFYRYQPLKEK